MKPLMGEINKAYGLTIKNRLPKIVYGLNIKMVGLKNIPRKLSDTLDQTIIEQENEVHKYKT